VNALLVVMQPVTATINCDFKNGLYTHLPDAPYNRGMQYLIDGHNLIPKVPGLSLSDPDDEEQLINKLSGWARISRQKIIVFFDRAPQGKAGTRRGSPVIAVFVPDGKTADSAITDTLAKLKGAARNVAVVSSDRMVQAAARAVHAKVVKSEDFAAGLFEFENAPEATLENSALTSNEIAEWERIFSSKKD
jgi:predicted RNA-binding protein with PIN domain